MEKRNWPKDLEEMTYVHVILDDAFKNCCMRSGRYDGAQRDHFFQRVIFVSSPFEFGELTFYKAQYDEKFSVDLVFAFSGVYHRHLAKFPQDFASFHNEQVDNQSFFKIFLSSGFAFFFKARINRVGYCLTFISARRFFSSLCS